MVLGALALATSPACAADKFKVTGVDCEMFWQWKHTPVIHYDIIDERKADYDTMPNADYFAGAATRTTEYCDRTSQRPQAPLGPPRKIRGIWFQSNDGQFKILFDLDRAAIDTSAGEVDVIADKFAAEQQAAARHQAALEEIRTREARAKELEAAKESATSSASTPNLTSARFASPWRRSKTPSARKQRRRSVSATSSSTIASGKRYRPKAAGQARGDAMKQARSTCNP